MSSVVGQNSSSSSLCPEFTEGSRAFNRVKFFIVLPDRENLRQETGAVNEKEEQIRPVTEESACTELNELILTNEKYAQIDSHLREDRAKYYYQTNNFYYIFWTWKPEFDDVPKLGPKTIFIVVKKEGGQHWEYYL